MKSNFDDLRSQLNSKFFTNEDKNTLLEKFKGVFTHRNIHYFDALVGFFRVSGYFKIRKELENVAKIRILVGIDVDKLTAKYIGRGSEIKFVADDVREDFIEKIKSDIQNATYQKEVEDGMMQFVEDIASGKIEVKAHPSQKIHAKVYIFREKVKHGHGYGVVITGSSNLTYSGLENNFEFNVEMRDNDDIEYAYLTFEKLWQEAIAINPDEVTDAKSETYLNDNFTPFEVYIKFLIEYFGGAVEYDPESVGDLPKGFMRLSYQIDAVNDGYSKLIKHNGFFLADVVGLGKTVIATMIANRFYYMNGPQTKTLIIIPPALYQSWEETLEKFRFRNYKIITNGSLHKIKNPQSYDLIIVDEAHKFRSSETQAFNELQKIAKTPCRDVGRLITEQDRSKKIILVSATPLNNKPEDLRNLVYLFQDAKKSSLEIGNIQHFFYPLVEEYKQLKKEEDIEIVKAKVSSIYDKIRENVVAPLTVRRTRTDIEIHDMYSLDLEKQGIRFPKSEPPRKILYQLDGQLDKLYDDSMMLLSNGVKYARYQAIKYLMPDLKVNFPKADMVSDQLAKIMKMLLVKRLDSSFHAFKSMLTNFQKANDAMIKMFENDKIFIAPDLKGKVSKFILENQESDLEEMVLQLIEAGKNAMICSEDDFQEGYFEMLQSDKKILDELVTKWEAVKKDPKFDEFYEQLQHEFIQGNPEKKVVVFSESAVTVNYLIEKLTEKGREDVLAITSANRKNQMSTIRANFDANLEPSLQRDKYNVVISTEVLAEGVNLHRSNVIVNYDTPWNSTRLMQRIGRVNRVGSKAEKIFVFNFFPTAKVDSDIDLKKKAIMKLQAFHAALGEDSQIYSREEEFGTFGLFEEGLKDEDADQRLTYLMELRKFKDANPEEFKRIQKMPLRARVGRNNEKQQLQTITFIKTGKRDAFYQMLSEQKYEELTFTQAAEIFKATIEEKAVALPDFHYEHISTALELFEKENIKKVVENRTAGKSQSPSEKSAAKYLRAFLKLSSANANDKKEIKWALDMMRVGRYTQMPRTINKIKSQAKKNSWSPVKQLGSLIQAITDYSEKARFEDEEIQTTTLVDVPVEPEIIISESFL
jgi:superfamily II DNA/RNA helicase